MRLRFVDPDDGDRERDEALARVDAGADPLWKAHADDAIDWVHANYSTWTTDEVWWRLDFLGIPRPPEQRAIAGPVRRARKQLNIEEIGKDESLMKDCHRRPKSLYRGLGHLPRGAREVPPRFRIVR